MPELPTDLVYLSIGSISNHLHQFEYPSWILWNKKNKNKKKTNTVQCEGKTLCWYYFSIINDIVRGEPAVAPHAKCISNKGKPDPGNTSLWLSGHFLHFSPTELAETRSLYSNTGRTCRVIWRKAIKSVWKIGLAKKIWLGLEALTRNEAKSISTRLLAGESFAIFQIKAELFSVCTKNDCRCIICRHFGGYSDRSRRVWISVVPAE